jgi:hypothetical protein
LADQVSQQNHLLRSSQPAQSCFHTSSANTIMLSGQVSQYNHVIIPGQSGISCYHNRSANTIMLSGQVSQHNHVIRIKIGKDVLNIAFWLENPFIKLCQFGNFFFSGGLKSLRHDI